VLCITGGGVLWGGDHLHDAVRSVGVVDVVTQIELRVPDQGGWTVFQIRDFVAATPVLVAVGGFGEELSLGGVGAGGGGGSRGGGRGFGG